MFSTPTPRSSRTDSHWAGTRSCTRRTPRHWFYRTQLSHRWGYWLERRAVRRARATVALTEPLARTMRRQVPSRHPLPISVIPFGVDTERFQPNWSARRNRRALGVGVVLPFKRWEWAAQALRGTGLELRIAGPQPSPEYAARVRASRGLGRAPGRGLRGRAPSPLRRERPPRPPERRRDPLGDGAPGSLRGAARSRRECRRGRRRERTDGLGGPRRRPRVVSGGHASPRRDPPH